MAFTKPNVNVIWANTGEVIAPDPAKVAQGWISEIPDFEFENWIQNRQDQFNAHINQYGIPVWDSTTEYQANKSHAQGSDGVVYKALTTNTNKNPTTNPSDWKVAFDASGTSYTKAESDNKYLAKSSNLSDLTNTVTARTNLSVYSKAEGDGRYLRISNNLSDLTNTSAARSSLGVYSTTDVYTKAQADARYLVQTNNLSDLTNDANARTNLSVFSKAESDARYLSTTGGTGFEIQKSSNQGYQKLPSGLVFQWGRVFTSTDGAAGITFDVPLSQLYQVQATLTRNSSANLGVSTYSYSGTGFTLRNSDAAQDVVWFAIGLE